jgi:hypothetical protein
MAYNLVSAAASTGVNRSTILRSIKAGRISAQRDATGGWQIEPAELHRVFPAVAQGDAEPAQQAAQPESDQVALLRNMISMMERRVEDLQQERDRWHEAFQGAQRLLPAPATPRNGIFRRLMGRG